MSQPDPTVLVVKADGAGSRIDAWLAGSLDVSRTRAASLIEDGRVLLNGQVPRKSEILADGDRIEVRVPPLRRPEASPEPIPLDIVYEDDHLLVVDKPSGMVVHPAPGHASGTLVNALLHHADRLSAVGGPVRPGLVHRLDRDTSGLLVVAKEDRSHRLLSEALRKRQIRRLYVAAAWGHLPKTHLRVDQPIGRHPRDRKRMAVVPDGRRAVTRVRVEEHWPAAELLEVALETGRTHQIRVHLAHIGHPVVGDRTYGSGWERGMGGPDRGWARELSRRAPRQFLHSARLGFEHPATGQPMRFRSPLPDDLQAARDWAVGSDQKEEGEASGRLG